MKEPKFIQKVFRKGSAQVFEFSDIERIRKYQQNLIDFIIYSKPCYPMGGTNHLANAKIHQEIKNVEKWLKSMTCDFMLNNLREFQL